MIFKLTKRINILVYLLMSISLILLGLGYYFYNILHENLNIDHYAEGYLLEIAPKEKFKIILSKLTEDQILPIANKYAVYMFAKFNKYDRRIQAGEYLIPPKTNSLQLLQKIIDGKVILHKFTIVEGLRFEQLLELMNNNDKVQHTLASSRCQDILQAINRTHFKDLEECEGLFLPDTYMFPKGTKDITILQQAYDNMQNRLNDLWNNSAHGALRSSYEALIMASIIEKETAAIDEMCRISGVYHKRLRTGLPLQADPTVIYGLKIFDRPLTIKDLKKKSDYNTYSNKGLPPSPIATPSIPAIFAALNPLEEDFLYFVADGTTGRHIFSTSLLEHNRAIWKIKNSKLELQASNSISQE